MVDMVAADVVVARAVPEKGAFDILRDLPRHHHVGSYPELVLSWLTAQPRLVHLHGTLQGGSLRSKLGDAAALPEGDDLAGVGGIRIGKGAAQGLRNLKAP